MCNSCIPEFLDLLRAYKQRIENSPQGTSIRCPEYRSAGTLTKKLFPNVRLINEGASAEFSEIGTGDENCRPTMFSRTWIKVISEKLGIQDDHELHTLVEEICP